MTTRVYEKSLRAETVENLIAERAGEYNIESLIVLPIPSTRDGKTVNGLDLSLHDSISGAGMNTLVLGYEIPDYIKERLDRVGAICVDSATDEEFLLENAELTAVATLGIILNTEVRAPRDMSIGVVGYGRIGKCLVRELLFHGARVTVYTSRPLVRESLSEYGVATLMSDKDASLGSLDLLINTAPAKIFDTGGGMPTSLRVIDLASGVNFPGLASVERYPSLPARMFPRSAGGAWFRSVMRTLGRE